MGIQINGQTDTVTATDGSINIGGDVTVPGVLTYEDVTSVDSVGIVTAQSGIHVTGGSVGIGTDNPVDRLHLAKNSATGPSFYITNDSTGHTSSDGLQIGYDGSNDVEFRNRENTQTLFYTNNIERVRITSAGLVGIGTNDPSWGVSTGLIVGDGASAKGITLFSNSANVGDFAFADATSGTARYRGLIRYDHSDDSLAFRTNSTERLRITSAGNVGINSTIPRSKLHVASGTSGYNTGNPTGLGAGAIASIESNGTVGLQFLSGNSYNNYIYFGDTNSATTGSIQYSHGANALIFNVNGGTERLRITSAGTLKVGSNTLISPSTDADNFVIDTGDVDSGLSILSATTGRIYFGDAASTDQGSIRYVHTDDSMRFETNSSEKLRITSGGQLNLAGNMQFTAANPELEFNNGGPRFRVPAANTLTIHTGGGLGATSNERLRITSAGQMGLGTNDPNSYGGNVKLAVANTSGTCGLSIVSATNGDGNLYYADGTSGDATYRGYIRYNHTLDEFRIGIAGAERLRITPTNASVSSAGSGANGIGCFGINDTSPDSNALALSLRGTYGMEDPRPLVYLQRSYGVGGGSSTDETTLEIDAPGSYNSAGVVYGIKSRVQHNLNGSHYAGHFEGHGSQYSANGTSALYAKTTKLDTNGMGDVIAFRADASITTGIANNGAAIAGYFASGNNVNGKPIVCQNGYTTNSYSNQIIFRKHNGSGIVDVGSIKSNNTATQYNTSSDYRLKENIVSLTGAIDRLKQLQPKRFNFIGIDETIDGFIAHEVNPVAPYAVSGEKDAVKKELVLDEDGKEQFGENGEIIHREVIDPQGVDYSKLTTLTIAALQEALAKIETLEAKVAVLEGS